MKLIDLTLPIPCSELEKENPEGPWTTQRTIRTREWVLGAPASRYTARVHYFAHWGMAGTYIDFPGHIVTT
ncbi:hypothetical protein HQ590_04755, partial [bacterium]|nr:hypothetical protein [bacterium]